MKSGKAITAKGLEVLEYVGREAIDMIVTEAGIQIEDEPKVSDGDVIEEDEHFMDDVTFDRCFYIYGGPEQLEVSNFNIANAGKVLSMKRFSLL